MARPVKNTHNAVHLKRATIATLITICKALFNLMCEALNKSVTYYMSHCKYKDITSNWKTQEEELDSEARSYLTGEEVQIEDDKEGKLELESLQICEINSEEGEEILKKHSNSDSDLEFGDQSIYLYTSSVLTIPTGELEEFFSSYCASIRITNLHPEEDSNLNYFHSAAEGGESGLHSEEEESFESATEVPTASTEEADCWLLPHKAEDNHLINWNRAFPDEDHCRVEAKTEGISCNICEHDCEENLPVQCTNPSVEEEFKSCLKSDSERFDFGCSIILITFNRDSDIAKERKQHLQKEHHFLSPILKPSPLLELCPLVSYIDPSPVDLHYSCIDSSHIGWSPDIHLADLDDWTDLDPPNYPDLLCGQYIYYTYSCYIDTHKTNRYKPIYISKSAFLAKSRAVEKRKKKDIRRKRRTQVTPHLKYLQSINIPTTELCIYEVFLLLILLLFISVNVSEPAAVKPSIVRFHLLFSIEY
ncbi:uncharacterized protein [Amphiura filiformis]|uniref:uncharacterized protein n=1 Tax=Amphiura filiformis TaxID=82378 RepID=UPI003B212D4B